MNPFERVRAFTKRLFIWQSSKVQTSSPTTIPVNDPATGSIPQAIPVLESCSESLSPKDMGSPRSSSRHKLHANPLRHILRIFGQSKHDSAVLVDAHKVSQDINLPYSCEDVDQYSDDGEPDDEDEDDRRNFKAIRDISRKEVEEFVLETLYPGQDLNRRTCHVTKRKEGSFHHVVFVHVNIGDKLEQQYVLKIPAHGTPEQWEDADGFMLRNEAVLMQHIRHHTQCPVPEVVAFDDSVDNALAAPFILMKEMPGSSALDFWFGKTFKDLPNGEQYLEADVPSPELEQKRVRFLTSLAQAMSQLQTLEFKRIGVPVFDKPEDEVPKKVGPVWRWHSKNRMQQLQRIGPYPSEGFFYHYGMNAVWNLSEIEDRDPNHPGVLEFKGIRQILSMILYSPPFVEPAQTPATGDNTDLPVVRKKTFVLRHDDLNLQNILVDDDGNVTGLIDWDGCMSVPRCVGYSSLPTFLRGDWLDDHTMAKSPYMTWSLDHYRSVYATAMTEACQTDNGSPSDAQYTKKSAMYQALLAVFYEDEDCRQVIGKLLAEIEEFRRVDVKQFCIRLGKGWPAAEKVLKEKLAELLAPEVLECVG